VLCRCVFCCLYLPLESVETLAGGLFQDYSIQCDMDMCHVPLDDGIIFDNDCALGTALEVTIHPLAAILSSPPIYFP
jgi:hypothetical protein